MVKNIRLNFNILGEDTPIGWLKNCFTAHTLPCIISVRLGLNWSYKVLVAQSCLTLCDPLDYSPLGYYGQFHRIFQARILEWVAISFSRGSSWSRDQILISCISYIGRQVLYHWATGEAQIIHIKLYMVGGGNKSSILPGGSDSKASSYRAGDPGSIPGSGRSPGKRNGNPLQYSCLEISMDRGAW